MAEKSEKNIGKTSASRRNTANRTADRTARKARKLQETSEQLSKGAEQMHDAIDRVHRKAEEVHRTAHKRTKSKAATREKPTRAKGKSAATARRFPVVGIGASAGLEAITELLEYLPEEDDREEYSVIDHFLRSLAAAEGGNAIGIILSGNGSDGTQGLLAVKAAGGITFYREFDVNSGDTLNQPVYELGSGQWDIAALRNLLEKILPENTSFRDYDVERAFPGIGKRKMRLNARRLKLNQGTDQMILLAIEEVNESA